MNDTIILGPPKYYKSDRCEVDKYILVPKLP